MDKSAERRPRFRRVATAAITLTERDIEILRTVHRFRFVRSTHLLLLAAASYKPFMRRLQLLYHNHYLDRPRAQIEYYGPGGSKPMVYALGNRGADALAEFDGERRAKVDWTAKNRETGRLFIEHTLLIADVMIALTQAAAQRADVRLIDGTELLSTFPAATQHARNPFLMPVRVVHRGEAADIGLVPDRVFALEFPDANERSYFFLEADRATMPVTRKSLDQTSILRKLLGYQQAWRQGISAARFGFQNVRTLFVTSSPERVQSMFSANRDATQGSGSRLFLFTDSASFTTGDILEHQFLNGRGEVVRLVD
ncbi:MAG: replication-relaxation family protein [Burkholderiales bacterium]